MIHMMLDDLYPSMPWDKIDAVVFDVGNVLLRWDSSSLLQKILPDRPDLHPILRQLIFQSPYWVMQDRGIITPEEAITGMTARHPELEPFVRRIMNEWVDLEEMPEGIGVLKACKAHGKKVYVLSNYPKGGFQHAVETHAFFSLFDDLFVSSHYQLVKPESAIYAKATEALHLTPGRTLFIDDSPANIEAALHFGWQAFCVNAPGKLTAFFGQ